MRTFGEMKASLKEWMGEATRAQRLNDALNDAIISIWNTLMTITVSNFLGGPVTVSISSGSEEASVVSISDPLVAPTVADHVDGALAGPRDVVVAYTLVTESGSETLISPTTTRSVPANNVAKVTSPAFVEGAIGWNCYMGSVSGRLAKQNETPTRFGDFFYEASTGFSEEPNLPSPPVVNNTGDDIYYIASISVDPSTGGRSFWRQSDMASKLMRSLYSSIPITDKTFPYAFDLINQRTIRIAPKAGTALDPSYIYVKRPRRIRFDNSIIPFQSIDVEEFLRCHALSSLMLGNHEYEAADRWTAKAEIARVLAAKALNKQNVQRNTTVRPVYR
jgi:hypothetical protein